MLKLIFDVTKTLGIYLKGGTYFQLSQNSCCIICHKQLLQVVDNHFVHSSKTTVRHYYSNPLPNSQDNLVTEHKLPCTSAVTLGEPVTYCPLSTAPEGTPGRVCPWFTQDDANPASFLLDEYKLY